MKKELIKKLTIAYEERAYKSLVPSAYGGYIPDEGWENWEEELKVITQVLTAEKTIPLSTLCIHTEDDKITVILEGTETIIPCELWNTKLGMTIEVDMLYPKMTPKQAEAQEVGEFIVYITQEEYDKFYKNIREKVIKAIEERFVGFKCRFSQLDDHFFIEKGRCETYVQHEISDELLNEMTALVLLKGVVSDE